MIEKNSYLAAGEEQVRKIVTIHHIAENPL
jgi:hypothetical protein